MAAAMQHDLGQDLTLLSMKAAMNRFDGQIGAGLLC